MLPTLPRPTWGDSSCTGEKADPGDAERFVSAGWGSQAGRDRNWPIAVPRSHNGLTAVLWPFGNGSACSTPSLKFALKPPFWITTPYLPSIGLSGVLKHDPRPKTAQVRCSNRDNCPKKSQEKLPLTASHHLNLEVPSALW